MNINFDDKYITFFDAIKYITIDNFTYYEVDVPEISEKFYFSIDPIKKEVSYFLSKDFSKPIKTIELTDDHKTAYEVVNKIPGINTRVAVLLF